MYKVRTIDVWDTLLRRDCHPECIKLATANHLLFGWHDQIKPKFRDGWVLYEERLVVERRLADQAKASGKDNEYEITEVLAQWSRSVFASAFPPDLPNLLTELELSIEVDRSFVDPDIFEFLRYHEAEKTLFLSDFYMSSEMLRRLLSAKGLNTLIAEGLSSCDLGLNKRSGRIFRHVHAIHAISPQEHVHIGDNEWSDVSSPRMLGVHAVHYVPEAAHAERLAREQLFYSREALFDQIRSECADLAKDGGRGLSTRQAAGLSLGIQATPLFIGFALWIAEQAIMQKIDRLYFFTREGEFFQQVFCALFPQNRLFGHDLPPTCILEVSRLSTFAPSMRDASIQEMSRIWSLFKLQSVSGLFTTLGVDVKRFYGLLETLNLQESDVITDPESCPRLHRLFQASAFNEALEKSLKSQASMLQRYLGQCGVYRCDRIGVVDIGWRGSIQDNLSLVVPTAHFHGMYLGLRRFINAQPSNSTKGAYMADENTGKVSDSFFSNFAALELLCSAPGGSVIGYSMNDGNVCAQRNVDQDEDMAYRDFVKPFQDGVLIAAKRWQQYIERYAVTSNELHTVALHIWDRLRATPDESLVDIYLHTPQQDFFGYGEIFHRNKYPSFKTIFLSPISTVKRRELIEFVRRVQWSEAIEKAKDIDPVHRLVLIIVFRVAHFFKRAAGTIKSGKRR